MKKATITGAVIATIVVPVALACGDPDTQQNGGDIVISSAMTGGTGEGQEGLIHGRVTTDDGNVYEGRLRWGGDEEALWGNYFNGFKDGNPWVGRAPRARLPKGRDSLVLFGIRIAGWDRRIDLRRPFMARFGDIARIEPRGRDLRVILKSGTVFELDRFSADDLADGVRVWDMRGIVDIGEWKIRSIEFLADAGRGAAPVPMYGTVRTQHGDFTGFIQWDREACVGADELNGHGADGEVSLRFEAIRSIERRSSGSLVTLVDGREIVLSGTRDVGQGNRGIYVDDGRYGRVLVSWDAFERVDFSPGGAAPAYGDFPEGRPLAGTVVTRSGSRLTGRLVYDLDESETTETLDAPSRGVDYTIPFGLIASIVTPDSDARAGQHTRITLRSGEELLLEHAGDLGDGHAGMLVFFEDRERPEYVPWSDVRQVAFYPPPAMYPSARSSENPAGLPGN